MGTIKLDDLDIRNSIAVFVVKIPGVVEPRVVRRVTGPNNSILLIGEDDDPSAPRDLTTAVPDVALKCTRPESHVFSTDRPGEVVVVVGPKHRLDDETAMELAANPRNVIEMTSRYFILELVRSFELHVIAGLFGTGRRTLAAQDLLYTEAVAGPGHLTVIKTVTTHVPKSGADHIFYDFVTQEEFDAKEAAGELVQVSRIGKVCHGIDRGQLTDVMSKSDGLCILLEPRVDEFLALGYSVSLTQTEGPPGTPPLPPTDDSSSN